MKALALSFLIVASACFGTAARTNVLRPVIRTTYSHVRPLILRALPAELAATEREFHLMIQGDGPLVGWPVLRSFADRGVQIMLDRGEISRGVAQRLDEQIRKLDEMLRLL